jgi:hypothetical protein
MPLGTFGFVDLRPSTHKYRESQCNPRSRDPGDLLGGRIALERYPSELVKRVLHDRRAHCPLLSASEEVLWQTLAVIDL